VALKLVAVDIDGKEVTPDEFAVDEIELSVDDGDVHEPLEITGRGGMDMPEASAVRGPLRVRPQVDADALTEPRNRLAPVE
jgi:hypothetical protein